VIAVIPRESWIAGDLLAADRVVHAAEDQGAVELRTEEDLWEEVALRYQRLMPVANAASATPAFLAVLRAHRALHDLQQPLVRADHDHARDTWQWALRLDPMASVEVQLAALLHDVERLESEPATRVEHLAADYQRFKDAHARRGAELAGELVAGGPWDAGRVVALIERHERVDPSDGERVLLADADGLSFFALNSAGYLAWFGPEQTARKVAWTLRRMSPRARRWLARIRLPAEVRVGVVPRQRWGQLHP
jgi:hypothetical protein